MKQKITFLLKCTLVILPFIAISLYTKFNLIKFVDSELPYFIWNKDFCQTSHESPYNVLILGDSTSNAAYMPEVLSDSCVNLALGGTNPMDSYYIMKDWLKNNQAPKTVYISFADTHFSTADWFWTRTMFTHRFSIQDNLEMLKMATVYQEDSIISENDIIDFISYQLYLPNKYITALSNGGFNQRYETNLTLYAEDSLHNGHYMARGNKEWQPTEVSYEHFSVSPLFNLYYQKLIEMCLENHIQVHLIKLPLPSSTVFTSEYENELASYYDNLTAKYPKVTFDWIRTYEDQNFADPSHMNTHGSLKFSTQIKELYPDDFDSVYSDHRIEALNDNIRDENRIEEMFKWAASGPYTLLIYDPSGDFEQKFDKIFQTGNLVSHSLDIGLSEGNNLYFVADSSIDTFPSLSPNISHQTLEGQTSEMDYKWELDSVQNITFLIIDNFHNSVVCTKEFHLTQNPYVLVDN